MDSLALSPAQAVGRAFSGATKAAARHVRWTIVISVLLIFGSFVSAAVIQMRRDHEHELNQAAVIETRRAQELALDFASTFDRYAALGAAFANADPNVETSAALSEAGGPALQNIAVLDRAGRLLFELKRKPKDLLPLEAATLSRVAHGRTVFSADGARSMVLGFTEAGRLVLVQLAGDQLFPQASMEDDLLATPEVDILALGRNWRDLPPADALTLEGMSYQTRTLPLRSGGRLLAFVPLKTWPVTAGASVQVGEALSAWYGALPLYFFFILGPAFAGAGLAVVFVRELERRTRPYSADRLLRAKRNDEAKLLIRLADAERRAAEADRSKAEFITHMSHELRTPLNAIIGFSEVIEHGLFGKAGHPKYEEYAHDISEAGRRLHDRIDEVLQFAALEAGKQPITVETVDVAGLARQVSDEMSGLAFAHKIRVLLAAPDRALAQADAKALKRALTNLLGNALQYTRAGGQVSLRIRPEENDVLLLLHDSGTGFNAAERERAGQPFVRFDRPGMRTGTGLGIAIAGSLVRRMSGTLTISGKPGEGAAIEIRLRGA